MTARHGLVAALLATIAGCATAPESALEQRNKAIVLEVFAALESGDLATLERYFATDGAVIIGLTERQRGGPYATFREAAPFPGALSDVVIEVENIFADGDYVAIQSVICGNQVQPLLGIEATGKRLCSRYTNLYRLENGRIVSNTVGVYRDQLREQLTTP